MRIAFGTDEPTAVTAALLTHLAYTGHDLVETIEDELWPQVGHRVGAAVATGRADLGIVCCWTGTGVSIAANKVRGVRAALCTDAETARGARRWNDANVLALGLRLTTESLAVEITDAFLSTEVDDHERTTIRAVENTLGGDDYSSGP